ncbi:MAG: hypothetical protein KC615_06870 [Anaerolineae bacterium]|nr:hypothetical protein [Anaerolineae bacterium]
MTEAHVLQNAHWLAGILPQTGASIAFGRVRYSGNWINLMRSTDDTQYGNSSNCSSFIMLPWANRIRDGVLHFGDAEYQLRTTKDDGTARHGDVRNRPWQIVSSDEKHIRMTFDSRDFDDVNFPFAFTAQAEYRLEDEAFIWDVSLTNVDDQPFPAGFGHHPYFVRTDTMPLVEIPTEKEFHLTQAMADDAPAGITDKGDFRELRGLVDGVQLDNLLTERDLSRPVRIVYPQWRSELHMQADAIFKHILIYTDTKTPSVAVEPQTNANDGFNLYEQGINGSGVFVLQPSETISGTVRLSIHPYEGA